jgi:hypothetical protein
MQVKLKEHVMEGGRIKASVHRNKTTAFTKDAVVDVSDATGKKWIERGWAEEVKPTAQPPEPAKETAPVVAEEKPAEPRRKK